jgi:hypothetical protein
MKQPELHPAIISIEVRPSDLARSLSKLSYDWLSIYIGRLAMELESDATEDSNRGRHKLAAALFDASEHLFKAQASLALAWSICQPHMKKENEEEQPATSDGDIQS